MRGAKGAKPQQQKKKRRGTKRGRVFRVHEASILTVHRPSMVDEGCFARVGELLGRYVASCEGRRRWGPVLVCGVNQVTRSLEQGRARAVIVVTLDVQPRVLLNHVGAACLSRQVPMLSLPCASCDLGQMLRLRRCLVMSVCAPGDEVDTSAGRIGTDVAALDELVHLVAARDQPDASGSLCANTSMQKKKA